jgi:hypothetical protein
MICSNFFLLFGGLTLKIKTILVKTTGKKTKNKIQNKKEIGSILGKWTRTRTQWKLWFF